MRADAIHTTVFTTFAAEQNSTTGVTDIEGISVNDISKNRVTDLSGTVDQSSSSMTGSVTSLASSPNTSKTSLSPGEIAGIAIGSFFGLVLLVVVGIFFYSRRARRQHSKATDDKVAAPTVPGLDDIRPGDSVSHLGKTEDKATTPIISGLDEIRPDDSMSQIGHHSNTSVTIAPANLHPTNISPASQTASRNEYQPTQSTAPQSLSPIGSDCAKSAPSFDPLWQ